MKHATKAGLRPEIFRKAMRLVTGIPGTQRGGDCQPYSCNCIDVAAKMGPREYAPERRFYERLFGVGQRMFVYDYDKSGRPTHTLDNVLAYSRRIIALELAALCVEDGLSQKDLA